jgi:ribonuclease T2
MSGNSRWQRLRALLLLAALALAALEPVLATVPTDGTLTATRPCPAPSAIRRDTNAGDVRLTPGTRYHVVGRNRADASHYLIEIDGARPSRRWVSIDCGRLEVAGGSTTANVPPADTTPPIEPQPLILAISWQPAFCEGHPNRSECRALAPGDPAAGRFSLHGLWPQPRSNAYCDVPLAQRAASQDGDWHRLPRLDLSSATRARLTALMPGTRSQLQRHEWTKHGSCYGADAETYIDDSLDLLEQVNASPLMTLFTDNIGRHLRSSEIRTSASRAFGRGAGERIGIVCDDGLITELRISLKGVPGDVDDIGTMLRSAPPKSIGCRGGRIDAVGTGRH